MNEKTEILNDIENELARLEGAIHGNDGDAISFLRGQVMKVIKMEESEHPSPALQDAVKETNHCVHRRGTDDYGNCLSCHKHLGYVRKAQFGTSE